MKITLYLMTQKGHEVLQAIIDKQFSAIISEVVVGRDKKLDHDFADEIISLCSRHNIDHKERNDPFQISSDYSIAISWRWLIPESSSRLIVLHDSLLPKYRGFAPLVNMLCNREPEIGVTALFASAEYDRGDIIAQSSTKINYPIKISRAIELIAQNYIELVITILTTLQRGDQLVATKQDESLATYSLWRDEEDYTINWHHSSEDILTFINAVSSPYSGAASYLNGRQKCRILDAELEDDVKIENRDVGKVIFVKDGCPVSVCGRGLLRLIRLVDDATQADLLPLKNFRVRFTDSSSVQPR